MDIARLERVGEYSGGRMEWTGERFEDLVYLILFEDDFYIGSTSNIRRRFSQYIADLTHNKYKNEKLQAAFNKTESFSVYCLEWVKERADLTKREKFYIDSLSPSLNIIAPPKIVRKESPISHKVKEILRRKGLTVQDLADYMGISRASLVRSLKENTTVKRIQEIAVALGVDVCDIIRKEPVFVCSHCGKPLNIKIE